MSGYHVREIRKGTLGFVSKIREELEELEDAVLQNNTILCLCELADLYGAIEAHLEHTYPSVSMEDLRVMAHATRKAFMDGSRQ